MSAAPPNPGQGQGGNPPAQALPLALAQPAVPAQPAPQPPPPVQFALTPAQANQNILDLSSAAGQKLYKAAIAPLTTLFDGTAATIRMFLSDVAARDVAARAESFHWHTRPTLCHQSLDLGSHSRPLEHRLGPVGLPQLYSPLCPSTSPPGPSPTAGLRHHVGVQPRHSPTACLHCPPTYSGSPYPLS